MKHRRAAKMPMKRATKKRPERGPRHLVCGFASPAVIAERGTMQIVKGRGVYVWDAAGRKYIDGLASLWNVNVGHGRASIARAAAKQMRAIEFAPTLLGFSSKPAEELAARIVRMAPKGLTRVAFTSGGSEANESVIRLVRLYWRLRGQPDKIKIVALNRAYHGSSNGAVSLTGLPFFHQYYEPLLPGVLRMVRPFCYRCELKLQYPSCALACADELERVIRKEGADHIGAFIAEPVQGVGGVVVPPDGYHQRIRAICDKYDVLMIADEVITGFGRLGHPFGINRWQVVPDMISFAKGVTSGYLPLGGVLMKEEIYQTLVDAGPSFSLHHGFTYSGHPVVCAAALANLDILEEEKLLTRARKLAPYFAERLRTLERHAVVGEVRATGLMAALELVRDKRSKEPLPTDWNVPQRIRNHCIDNGVIVRASVDTIAVCPPLIIKRKQIDQIVAALNAAIEAVAATL
jgi:adenosylmethionine-8-amino-7-oxononanoate aminotransferase